MEEKERIEKIMETEGLNATQFAFEIGIQNSTLSHILKGRNKPSLDVIKRILNRFRTINSDWLMLGVGSMYRTGSQTPQPVLFDIKPDQPLADSPATADVQPERLGNLPVNKEKKFVEIPVNQEVNPAKSITRIVVFYSDNSFDELVK